MTRWFALAIPLVLLLAGGCASSESTFVFTPVPYTVVAEAKTPLAISIAPSGAPYIADEVVAVVERASLAGFKDWAASQKFEVLVTGDHPLLDTIVVTIKVPLGSVFDAVPVIEKRPGVKAASAGYLRGLREETPIGEQ